MANDTMFARVLAIMVFTATVLGACGSSAPYAVVRGITVRIAGEFRPDGTCTVSADSVPIFAESEKPRTIYLRGRALNMAPDGFDVHEIWCAPITAGEPMLPDQPNERAFFINVYAPSGKLAPAQHYMVRRGLPTSGSAIGPAVRANVLLFGHDTTSRASGPGNVYLTGAVGDLNLTQVDSARVVGTFSAIAVPERSM